MDLHLLLNPCLGHKDMDASHLDPCSIVRCVEFHEAPTKKRRPPVQHPSTFYKRPRVDYTISATHEPHVNSACMMYSTTFQTHSATESHRLDRSHEVNNAHCHPYNHQMQPSSTNLTCHVLFKHHSDVRTAFLDVGFDANSIFNQICPLRKGRWRHEEEAYAIELVKMVHANRLPLKFRQSLRTFLAQKLHSDEMRRGHVDEDAVVTGTAYENERSIEPLETLRRAFLKSVQIEVVVAMREYDK
ncbi:hypothetical protein SPRG_06270 [Saprolegnia parasitica CBS 223.65]|uniref:Uncharacterized protein n=1 Tax=Saprolegnia parasitica (strain CBS 223.65) TaxID=695850 RepID=A0A067CNY4_SAPPC|nr:hypothetical protein SPRG_06270 [Saprolegnia parasitica CBS 223.65]KDO28221.1 hypothetical protein SPRG_06270 [Saprolegnia parasitica CBS 223.65]|eukprot:XP_012201046.1 hypothetical protein SPRG_06270 [Saprolegnia parasitica CBS 223.65]